MKTNVNKVLDALIVGAGPAGIGCALALDAVEDLRFGVVDRGAIGQTFLDWPVKQKLLTPSFTSNGYGSPDLNSIHPDTSPAYSFNSDYLTGRQYADYLRGVVKSFPLPVLEHTEVTSVVHDGEVFITETDKGPVMSHTVIWAGGEYHDRPVPDLPGAEFLDHSASEQAWARHDGPVVIIGGYESGFDLACHHIADGADVTVVDGNKPWDAGSISDPSIRLAPRSLIRLREAQATGRLTLIGSPACSVTRDGDSFLVLLENGQRIATPERAIAATGFGPGLGPVREFFEQRADGWPLLDENDCSTLIPGLFLSGPAVRHGGLRFCFIYKYRQRFAHIARVIGESRGQDCHNLDFWRDEGMLIDDLSCCGTDCTC